MKYASATLLLSALGASADDALRGSSATTKYLTTLLSNLKETVSDDEEVCNGTTDASTCNANSACTWCECQAVPSECVTLDQAKRLPEGVFQCASKDEQSESSDLLQATYDFKEGVTHSISDGTVPGSLCDSSSPVSLSGYHTVSGSKYDDNGEDKHLFYWFFEKRGKTKSTDSTVPLVLWLTGGPGCSSSLALLTENGPCSVNDDGVSTKVNPFSWTEAAHVLWLDQPAGVGYSFGSMNDSNEEMVGEDAYYFLQSFLKAHPEYKENPLFVTGESYGGHYAPAIANRVRKGNKNLKEGLIKIDLKGLAVGNGLTKPEEQYKYYAEMAYKNSHGIKVVSESTYNAMKTAAPACTALIRECNNGDGMLNTLSCQGAFFTCNMAETAPYQLTGLNPYDIRKQCEVRPLCYDFSHIEKFLNLDSTKKALHVTDKSGTWRTCNMMINMKFHTDWMKDMSGHVKDLLENDVPVLIYAGDVDFICNYLGNEAWTKGLEWSHGKEFNAIEPHEWLKAKEGDAKGKGLARSSNGFTFLQVYDAGHMVPTDQPEAALEMIKTFVDGGKF